MVISQVVAMSATLSDVDGFARWIDAAVFCNDDRPVELKHHLVYRNHVYDSKFNVVRRCSARGLKN